MKQNIKNLSLAELNADLLTLGLKPYVSRQIFDWLYKKGVDSFRKMSNISKYDISILEGRFDIKKLTSLESLKSKDGSEKFLFELSDKTLPSKEQVRSIPLDRQSIETVFIPANNRNTGCLSTQVGCKFRCLFCASGRNFIRDLTTAEITSQLSQIINITGKAVTHLVFMGIGEPLDNYDNVISAIRIFNSSSGFNIGARRITISTCGIIPEIEKLKDEGLQIELSISLHTADNSLRTKLMPVNKKYPLKELLACARNYIKHTNRQITFEYVLLKGINDGLGDADKLSKVLKGLNCKVNLILYNISDKDEFQPPVRKDVLAFKNRLKKCGIHATLRVSRGADISAACGQLRIRSSL